MSHPEINSIVFSRFCLSHIFFSSSSKSNVVILPMIHQALVLHKYKETKSLRADSSSWHFFFFFFSPSHSSLPEDLKEWVKAYISQTILPSPGERSASSTTPLLVIFLTDNEESGSSRAVNTSLRPPSHRLKSFSFRNTQFVCFDSAFQAMTSTPSANLLHTTHSSVGLKGSLWWDYED